MRKTTLLTFAEFERLPDQPGKDELVDGELFHLPPAFYNHSTLVGRIFALLMQLIDGPTPRLVQVEADFKIGEKTWLVPDVSVLHEHQPRAKYFEGAVAIEVISESNTARQIDRKRKIYLENAPGKFWVIYPERNRLGLSTRFRRRVHRRDPLQSVSGSSHRPAEAVRVNFPRVASALRTVSPQPAIID